MPSPAPAGEHGEAWLQVNCVIQDGPGPLDLLVAARRDLEPGDEVRATCLVTSNICDCGRYTLMGLGLLLVAWRDLRPG